MNTDEVMQLADEFFDENYDSLDGARVAILEAFQGLARRADGQSDDLQDIAVKMMIGMLGQALAQTMGGAGEYGRGEAIRLFQSAYWFHLSEIDENE